MLNCTICFNVLVNVATCDLSSELALGNPLVASSAVFHLGQSELDFMSSLSDNVALMVISSLNRIAIGDGNFSKFKLTVLSSTGIDFTGSTRFSTLLVGDDATDQVLRLYVLCLRTTAKRLGGSNDMRCL